jgi:YfiH family protein
VSEQRAPATTASPSLPDVPGDFDWIQRLWGTTLVCRRLHSFHHGWTTRQVEIPPGSAASGHAWQQLAEAAGVDLGAVIRLRQVHGARVVHATGTLGPVEEADAVMSRESGILLTVQVADCVPLLIGDPMTGASAAVHAGWRGTSAGIGVRAVEELSRTFGSCPGNLVAAIGPSIGPCCYTVGSELLDVFRAARWPHASVDRWFQEGSDIRLDLWQANREQLMVSGVPPGSISVSGLCTACHPAWLHSYRRDREHAGRLIGFIRPLAFGP